MAYLMDAGTNKRKQLLMEKAPAGQGTDITPGCGILKYQNGCVK
jgi:hypothetical protein